jgi:hypothetical protein
MKNRRVLVIARRPLRRDELERPIGLESEVRIAVVGTGDPLPRIAHELSVFAADEIVFLPSPVGDDVIDRACERFGLPVLHVAAKSELRELAAA